MMMIKRFLLVMFLAMGISNLLAQEICSNGIDDDGDGLVDLNDIVDCPCLLSGSIGEVTSLIPNNSFEDFAPCPNGPGQIFNADGWNAMTSGSPDYFNVCDPFSAIVPAPFPDGNGVAGFGASNGFLEYIGIQLPTPLVTGEDYRMDFDIASAVLNGNINTVLGPPIAANIKITLYGNVDPDDFPVPVNTGINFPPPSDWIELGFVTYFPSDNWTSQTFTFTSPIDAEVIAFGPPSFLPLDYQTANNTPYFWVDDLVLNLESAFSTALSLSGELCLGNSMIESIVPDPSTQWFFNGEAIPGQVTDDIDVSAVGMGAGEYSLAIFPVTGCAFSSITVLDNDSPLLSFTLSDLCPPGDVTFTSTSTIASGTIDSTVWDVGTIYSSVVAVEAFPTPGVQSITLSAFSDVGCQTDSSFNISIEAPPIASFSYVPDCFNNPLQFTDLSSPGSNGSPIAGGLWDFNGLGASIDQNPTFQFPDTMDYDVTLTVSTAGGCSDDTTITISTFPIPDAGFTNTVACIGQGPITFTNTSTIDEGTIDDIQWDLGDMTMISNLDSLDHLYASAGDFNVSITATSDQGCIDTETNVVTISTVTASFSTDDFDGCSPHCVEFLDMSTTNSGTIDQWQWTFTDSIVSTDQDPQRCFNNFSSENDSLYGVQLVVWNDFGCSDTLIVPEAVEVFSVPDADFAYLPEEITSINPTVSFINYSDGGSLFTWQLGEEFLTTENAPVYTFDAIGFVEVTMIATTFNNCSDTVSKFLRISPEETIYVPSAFTPDEDGLNDLFFPVIEGAEVDLYDFKMYDRFGHIVFETEDHTEKWNGQFKGYEENYTTDGLYSWYMRIKFLGSTETILKQGVLRVFR